VDPLTHDSTGTHCELLRDRGRGKPVAAPRRDRREVERVASLVLQAVELELEPGVEVEPHVRVTAEGGEGGWRRRRSGRDNLFRLGRDHGNGCVRPNRRDPRPPAALALRQYRPVRSFAPGQGHQPGGNAETVPPAGGEIGPRGNANGVTREPQRDLRVRIARPGPGNGTEEEGGSGEAGSGQIR